MRLCRIPQFNEEVLSLSSFAGWHAKTVGACGLAQGCLTDLKSRQETCPTLEATSCR